MNEQLFKLKEIETKARAISSSIDVNCADSQKQYEELAQLANELCGIIKAVEAA